jgi:hypothetical protein
MVIDVDGRLDGSNMARSIMAALVALSAGGVLSACNTHPVSYQAASGAVDRVEDTRLGGSAAVDLLWVIDDSASMCQEQRELRNNFQNFIDQLGDQAANFHIAVTTTSSLGPIQSQPSPVTAEFPACLYKADSRGRPIGPEYNQEYDEPEQGVDPPNYEPVREQIEQAVECTKNPEQYRKELLEDLSRDKIACEIDKNESACQAIGKDTKEAATRNLFPPSEAYREIDTVLRAADYRSEDGLARDQLNADFSCMSFVGTQGNADEQGLKSAVEAVSPENTGGPADLPESERSSYDIDGDGQSDYNPDAPNHGFLRRNASFAVVFVTDENDCSLQEGKEMPAAEGCADKKCYFLTKKDDPSPLADVDALQQEFMRNLARSKGLEYDPDRPEAPGTLDTDNVLAASIHGGNNPSSIKDANPSTDTSTSCSKGGEKFLSPICANQLGEAFTGGRYDDFIRDFENSFLRSNEASTEPPYIGEICQGTLTSAIEGIASFIPEGERTCVPNRVISCTSSSKCPPFEFSSSNCQSNSDCQQQGRNCVKNQCVRKVCRTPDDGRNFCRSAIQVRVYAPESADNPRQQLEQSGYCIEESIGAEGLKRGCVIKRSKYEWQTGEQCQGGPGLVLEWQDPTEVQFNIGNFDLRVRYTEKVTGERQQGDAGSVASGAADASNGGSN